jgi:gliding motility-associated-like protein
MGLGMRYIWDFDDGTPPVTTTTPFSSHVFLNPGVYRVSLTAINDTMCVPIDVVYQTINVGINRVTPQFSVTKLPPCDNFTMRFENLSVAPVGPPFGSNTFTWDFGDNSPKVKSGPNPVSHTFPAEGVYNVKLTIEDTAYCNAPVTLSQVVRISKNVKADFSMTPDTACTPLTYEFKNFSFNGQTFEWDFGDGTTFTEFAPPLKTYATIGTYQVKLKVRDPNTCNLIDSITKTLVVELINPPQASFTYSPNPSEENTPTLFTNTSTDAVRYKWEFGDGRQSTQKNPQYQYVGSAINKVCLTAYNILGCFTKKCDTVVSKVVNYFDVPNAFTPNGDGKNDKVAVRGFGIVKMDFKIFNRWGQLVFRSTDPLQGWDGYFQGRLQPMDVYGYTLEIETYDGQGFSKKGDITLLR